MNKERYPKVNSMWANPFTIKKYGLEKALELYKEHLEGLLEDDDMYEDFLTLKGKRLGCWCGSTGLCHGDIIRRRLRQC